MTRPILTAQEPARPGSTTTTSTRRLCRNDRVTTRGQKSDSAPEGLSPWELPGVRRAHASRTRRFDRFGNELAGADLRQRRFGNDASATTRRGRAVAVARPRRHPAASPDRSLREPDGSPWRVRVASGLMFDSQLDYGARAPDARVTTQVIASTSARRWQARPRTWAGAPSTSYVYSQKDVRVPSRGRPACLDRLRSGSRRLPVQRARAEVRCAERRRLTRSPTSTFWRSVARRRG